MALKRKSTVKGGARKKKARISRSEFADFASMAGMNRRGQVSKTSGYLNTAVSLNYDTAPHATTAKILLLNAIPQGSSVVSRVGKKVVLTSFQIRGQSYPGATGVRNDCAWLLVYDKRPRGVLPTVTDILDTVSANSMNKDDNSGRFKILRREDFMLIGATATLTNSLASRSEDAWLSLKNLPTTYMSVGDGTIGDIEEGALYLVTVGTNTNGTTAAILDGNVRVRFRDVLG